MRDIVVQSGKAPAPKIGWATGATAANPYSFVTPSTKADNSYRPSASSMTGPPGFNSNVRATPSPSVQWAERKAAEAAAKEAAAKEAVAADVAAAEAEALA
eukprot:7270130-Prymnesium_polylepis.1